MPCLPASYRPEYAFPDPVCGIAAILPENSLRPLGYIANLLLYSELIAEEELSEDMRSNVDAIRQQTEKLRFLIDSLVKLSRLENGILTLSPRREAVQPMLEDIQIQYA